MSEFKFQIGDEIQLMGASIYTGKIISRMIEASLYGDLKNVYKIRFISPSSAVNCEAKYWESQLVLTGLTRPGIKRRARTHQHPLTNIFV